MAGQDTQDEYSALLVDISSVFKEFLEPDRETSYSQLYFDAKSRAGIASGQLNKIASRLLPVIVKCAYELGQVDAVLSSIHSGHLHNIHNDKGPSNVLRFHLTLPHPSQLKSFPGVIHLPDLEDIDPKQRFVWDPDKQSLFWANKLDAQEKPIPSTKADLKELASAQSVLPFQLSIWTAFHWHSSPWIQQKNRLFINFDAEYVSNTRKPFAGAAPKLEFNKQPLRTRFVSSRYQNQ